MLVCVHAMLLVIPIVIVSFTLVLLKFKLQDSKFEYSVLNVHLKSYFSIQFSVITGVRFVKKEKAIFIQIQTGKLLPIGMIALETIAWQALPALGDTYTSVDYNHHQLALPDLTLPKKFALTGFYLKVLIKLFNILKSLIFRCSNFEIR